MKRLISLLLALVMITASTIAIAEQTGGGARTISVRLSVDPELAKTAMEKTGMPEERISAIKPILPVLSALGGNLVIADHGVQADLILKESTVLSLGGMLKDNALVLGSTLIPNYLISVSANAFLDIFQQFMLRPAAAGKRSGAGGFSLAAGPDVVTGYMNQFTEACTQAVTPGEPESGEYEFDGYSFDTHTPMAVDVSAMAEAERKLVSDLMKDETILSMLNSVQGLDAGSILKANEEIMAEEHLPDVTVDVYTCSDGSEPFYTVSEATYRGAESPAARCTMLNKCDGDGTIGFWAFDPGVIVGVSYSKSGFRMDYTMGETWLAAEMEMGQNVFRFDAYFLETAKPLLSLIVSVSDGGKRSLSLEGVEKNVVTMEDLTGEKASESFMGLMMDFMMNGWGPMYTDVSEASPEAAELLLKLMTTKGSSSTENAPAQEEAIEVDPSEWKTLADVLSLETEGMERGTEGSDLYYLAFRYGGKYWMVTADFSDELFSQLMDIDVFADDREEQQLAILGPLPVKTAVDLRTEALPQEELDQWIGKTGQEMLDEGWEMNGFSRSENTVLIYMMNGRFQYLVSFAEKIEAPQSFDDEPAFADKTVSGIEFSGHSYHYFDAE